VGVCWEGKRGESQKGMHPTWGLVIVERGGLLGEKCFEGLPGGGRGDALACRGHPYMFKISFMDCPWWLSFA
jgi:hypothetical protein